MSGRFAPESCTREGRDSVKEVKPSQFSLFGFGIRIEIFFGLLAVWVMASFSPDYVRGAAIVAAVGSSILVHELGHAFAFRRYGFESSIVLHGLGGYTMPVQGTRLTNGQDLLVSLAGPFTQIFGLGLPALLLSRQGIFTGTADVVVRSMVWFNLLWGVVNLLPVLPLDGGNIFFRGASILTQKNQIQLARLVSAAVAIPVGVAAYSIGYVFVALGAGYFAVNNLMEWSNSRKPPSARSAPRGFSVPPVPEAPPAPRDLSVPPAPGEPPVPEGPPVARGFSVPPVPEAPRDSSVPPVPEAPPAPRGFSVPPAPD